MSIANFAALVGCLPLADVLTAFRVSNLSGQVIVIILFIGSIFAWSVMLTKYYEMIKAERAAKAFIARYRQFRHPMELSAQMPTQNESPPAAVYRAVCRALAHAWDLHTPADFIGAQHMLNEVQSRAIHSLAEQTMAEQLMLLEKNMIFLATAVTAAPFLGLLGTVWGIMDAFGGLAVAGTATLAAVAPGVSGALLTTVVGLVVALPSAIGYNFLTGKIRNLNILMEHFAQEFLADVEKVYSPRPASG